MKSAMGVAAKEAVTPCAMAVAVTNPVCER